MSNLTLTINGRKYQLENLDPRASLLDVCRQRLDLTGAKKGCDHGQCGACTMIVNGKRINSCLTLAIMHDGDEIITIEGIGAPDSLSELQQAFIDHDAFQCGYCTPGQLCSATAMMEEIAKQWPSHVSDDLAHPEPLSLDEISERMSGNLCRCSAYPNIINAIYQVLSSKGLAKDDDNLSTASTPNSTTLNTALNSQPQIWSPIASNAKPRPDKNTPSRQLGADL